MPTAAETKFIDQMTRKLLVEWAHDTIAVGRARWTTEQQVYYEHARSKGWISKKEDRVLAQGFATAAAFLKR